MWPKVLKELPGNWLASKFEMPTNDGNEKKCQEMSQIMQSCIT